MTAAVQRSAADIDLWTQGFAEEQARRAGVTVRTWLNDFMARAASGAVDLPAADNADDSPPPDTVSAWSPSRDAFGQRASLPEAREADEVGQMSAAAILARAAGDPDVRVAITSTGAEAHAGGEFPELGRSRVAPGQVGARRRLESVEIEHLLSASAPPDEIDAQSPLGDVERALRALREQMEAPVQFTGTAAEPASHDAAPVPGAIGPEATGPGGTRPDAISPDAMSGKASSEAVANLAVDIARLVEVMNCGFDKIEAASARQTLELRTDVALMFDELAARFDKSEPPPEPQSEPLEDAAEAAPALAAGQLDLEPAPAAEADGVEWLDDADLDDAYDQTASASPPPVAATLTAPDAGDHPQPSLAAADPDAELFEDPAHAAGLEAAATPFDAPAASSEMALPACPVAEPVAHPWEPQAADDPDFDLFDPEPETAGAEAWTQSVGDITADPDGWATPSKSAPDPAGPESADEAWFAAARHLPGAEAAPDLRFPDEDEISVSRFDPFEPSAGQVADLAPQTGAKRARFAWLRFGRADQSRKRA